MLAGWRAFPVIARDSTFTFKGKATDIKKGFDLPVSASINATKVGQGNRPGTGPENGRSYGSPGRLLAVFTVGGTRHRRLWCGAARRRTARRAAPSGWGGDGGSGALPCHSHKPDPWFSSLGDVVFDTRKVPWPLGGLRVV